MAGEHFDTINGRDIDYSVLSDSTGVLNPAIANRLHVISEDINYRVSKGDVSTSIPITKIGYNGDVDADIEDLWPVGGAYVFPTAEMGMEIVSDSANDTAAGTGARTVRVYYLDSDFAEHYEDIELSGTTPVATTATDIYRVNEFIVTSVGSGGVAAGNIDVRHLDNTPVYCRIRITENIGEDLHYTVPANKSLYINQITISIGSAVTEVFGLFELLTDYNKTTGSVGSLFYTAGSVGVQNGTFTITYPVPVKIPPGVDIRGTVKGDNAAANAIATGQFRGWLETEA